MKNITIIFIFMSLFLVVHCGEHSKDQGGLRTGVNALPYASEAVFTLNLNKIITEFPQIFKKDKQFLKQRKRLLKKYGLDLNKTSITGAILNIKPDNQTIPQLVIFINTSYNQRKMMTQIKKEAKKRGRTLKQGKIANYPVLSNFKIKSKHFKNMQFKMAFINEQSILLASASIFNEVINLVNGKGKSVLNNPKMSSVINSLKKNNLFWGVSQINQSIKTRIRKMKLNPMYRNIVKQHLVNIANISAASHVQNKLNFAIHINHNNSKSANSWVKLLNNFKKLLPKEPIFKRIQINKNGNKSNISVSLSKKEFLNFKNKLK